MLRILWLQSGGCGGCTQSLLGSEPRSLFAELQGAGIEFVWHLAFPQASDGEARAILEACAGGAQPFDVLCVGRRQRCGAGRQRQVPSLAGDGRPLTDWVERLARRASWVFAIGSCSAFGGFSASTRAIPSKPAASSTTTTRPAAGSGAGFRSAAGHPSGQYRRLSGPRLGGRYPGKTCSGRLTASISTTSAAPPLRRQLVSSAAPTNTTNSKASAETHLGC